MASRLKQFYYKIIIFQYFLNPSIALQINTKLQIAFLSDIKEYYKSAGLLFLYDDNSDKFAWQSNIFIFLKGLSDRGIQSQTLCYSRIRDKSDVYLSLNVQSLLVVLISTQDNFDNFRAVTVEHDMSYHTWLIIFTEYINETVNSFCREPTGNLFHLIFNSRVIVRCYGEDDITKWYSLHKNRTEVLSLARWSPTLGIIYKNKNYYDNRYDLSGKTLKIATPTRATRYSNNKMYGFLGDILSEIQSLMNFTIGRVYENDAFGKWNSEKSQWSGLIGYLTSFKVDLVVAPISISKFRMNYVDYTIPILLSPNRIYIKQPEGAIIRWSAYFCVFTTSSWTSIILILAITSIIAVFIKLTIKNSNKLDVIRNSIFENFILIWGIYCQQGVSVFPSATSLRLTYLTTMLLALITWAIYSASITSYITFLSPTLPFSDTEGFVRDGSYQLIVLQNSSDQDIILTGQDPILTILRPMLKDLDDLPTNPFDGFQQVCDQRVGFYLSEAGLNGVSSYIPCTLTFIETGQFDCMSMALVKRSSYITSVDYNLRKLKDNGVIKKLKNRYFQKIDASTEVGHSSVGIWSVAPLLAILGSGLILSSFLLTLEHLYHLRFM